MSSSLEEIPLTVLAAHGGGGSSNGLGGWTVGSPVEASTSPRPPSSQPSVSDRTRLLQTARTAYSATRAATVNAAATLMGVRAASAAARNGAPADIVPAPVPVPVPVPAPAPVPPPPPPPAPFVEVQLLWVTQRVITSEFLVTVMSAAVLTQVAIVALVAPLLLPSPSEAPASADDTTSSFSADDAVSACTQADFSSLSAILILVLGRLWLAVFVLLGLRCTWDDDVAPLAQSKPTRLFAAARETLPALGSFIGLGSAAWLFSMSVCAVILPRVDGGPLSPLTPASHALVFGISVIEGIRCTAWMWVIAGTQCLIAAVGRTRPLAVAAGPGQQSFLHSLPPTAVWLYRLRVIDLRRVAPEDAAAARGGLPNYRAAVSGVSRSLAGSLTAFPYSPRLIPGPPKPDEQEVDAEGWEVGVGEGALLTSPRTAAAAQPLSPLGSAGGRASCSICFSGYRVGEPVNILHCACPRARAGAGARDLCTDGREAGALPGHHTFHAHCLTRWLEVSASCPVCRAPVLFEGASSSSASSSSSSLVPPLRFTAGWRRLLGWGGTPPPAAAAGSSSARVSDAETDVLLAAVYGRGGGSRTG
jgi:hypothetical protein